MIVFANENYPHYEHHLAPVARLIGDVDVALAASYGDQKRARRAGHKRIVLMQHGAGQSYSDADPHYPGGDDNDAVGLFLVPNEHAGRRWQAAYPAARVEVVGSPRLDDLPRRGKGPKTVAVSFHWPSLGHMEARSAWNHYRSALPDLARRFRVIGHSHPRWRGQLARQYAKMGIEFVPTFAEVCERADLYVADNTSTLFEFAATGRPVVVLNSPYYRRDVDHGLRFWEAADIGVQVDDPANLNAAVARGLKLRPEDVAKREAALDIVYGYRTGAAQRAAGVIREWADG